MVTTPASPAEGLVKGTPEQEAVWHALLKTDKHVIVEAVAGSGKTFCITQYAKRELRAKVGLVAFNKHIATELTDRMGGQSNVECMTYHSLGYRTVRNSLRGQNVRVDAYKVLSMLDGMQIPVADKLAKVVRYRIGSLVGYAKTYGYSSGVTRAQMEQIVDRHDVDVSGNIADVVYEFTPKVLARCMAELGTVDFDDMVWLPYVLGMEVPRYDVLCVDEYQDTSLTQQWMAVQAAGRLCAVGDARQAIYSFRGCDGTGFDKLRAELGANVVTLPLTLTRRCPKAHVRLAQTIVPQIKALPDAPEGIVRVTATVDEAVGEMRAGDLVVCRVNAELIGVAYKLLKRGVKAVVRGRDIGSGIKKLVDDAEKRAGGHGASLKDILAVAGEMTRELVEKFTAIPQGRGEMRAANAQDKYDCMCELAQEAKTVGELRSVIVRLFEDFEDSGAPKGCVVLGTVHRTKGLEGSRVFVLRPDLIPHPMAKRREDYASELNLAYVAVTRAKFGAGKAGGQGELIFVGGECSLFELPESAKVVRAEEGHRLGEENLFERVYRETAKPAVRDETAEWD